MLQTLLFNRFLGMGGWCKDMGVTWTRVEERNEKKKIAEKLRVAAVSLWPLHSCSGWYQGLVSLGGGILTSERMWHEIGGGAGPQWPPHSHFLTLSPWWATVPMWPWGISAVEDLNFGWWQEMRQPRSFMHTFGFIDTLTTGAGAKARKCGVRMSGGKGTFS